MQDHAASVLKKLQNNNMGGARTSVSMLVSRDTKDLNKKHVISATIESISENMVDGIISPIFYFTCTYILTNSIELAIISAVGFRIIGTLDSMIGYKDENFACLGRFSARLDGVLNYIPARLSLVFFLDLNSIKIASRDHNNIQSPNSGFPMGAMAGALNVRLEKPDCYTIGDEKGQLRAEHINIGFIGHEEVNNDLYFI